MKTYIIPVSWTVTAEMEIEAESLEKAIELADKLPLPTGPDYLDGSWSFDREMVEATNEGILSEDDENFLANRDENRDSLI